MEEGNNLTPEQISEATRLIREHPLPEKIKIGARTWALMVHLGDMLENIVEGRN